LASSTALRPAARISPARSSRSTRATFDADHALFGLRGVKRIEVRSISTVFERLSIQPKQSASSTASS
jgi:hypothetical protein